MTVIIHYLYSARIAQIRIRNVMSTSIPGTYYTFVIIPTKSSGISYSGNTCVCDLKYPLRIQANSDKKWWMKVKAFSSDWKNGQLLRATIGLACRDGYVGSETSNSVCGVIVNGELKSHWMEVVGSCCVQQNSNPVIVGAVNAVEKISLTLFEGDNRTPVDHQGLDVVYIITLKYSELP